ncbi:MAG: HAD-IIA family hydrolase [Halanaerobiaceae bacterium]
MNQLKDIELFLLDMDGTIYLGDSLINGANDFFQKLNRNDKFFFLFTNNSSKSPIDYKTKLEKLGINVPLQKIITSGMVTADYISSQKKNAVVYLLGTPSLERQFAESGLKVVQNKKRNIDFVVLGFDTTLNYKKLWDAHDLILDGVNYIATNPDKVCPLSEGKTMPDCGSMIKLLETSTGKRPLVIGKPNIKMIEFAIKNTNISKDKIALVGDRLYTDIKTANNAGITSILVLSGETNRKDLKNNSHSPDYTFDDIGELLKEI